MKTLERTTHEVKTSEDIYKLFEAGKISVRDIVNFECGSKELVHHLQNNPESIKGVYLISQRKYEEKLNYVEMSCCNGKGGRFIKRFYEHNSDFNEYKKMLQEAGIWEG